MEAVRLSKTLAEIAQFTRLYVAEEQNIMINLTFR